jgi:hypothetical protein
VSVFEDTRKRLLASSAGPVPVSASNLPESLIARAVDRLVEDGYLRQFCWEPFAGRDPEQKGQAPATRPREVKPPGLRGFRFQHDESLADQPGELDAGAAPWAVAAAQRVNERLAFDGLLRTTATVMGMPGPQGGWTAGKLASVGVPVDLLGMFRTKGAESASESSYQAAERVVQEIGSFVSVQAGSDRKKLERALRFVPRTAVGDGPKWTPCDEAGGAHASMVRVHLTRVSSVRDADEDGGSWHVFRQLLAALPGARFQVCAGGAILDDVQRAVAKLDGASRCEVIEVQGELSQWATDNGRPGTVGSEFATLVPRYASRGEEMSRFVPGDSMVWESLRRSGHRVMQSALLFQGGNLIVCDGASAGKNSSGGGGGGRRGGGRPKHGTGSDARAGLGVVSRRFCRGGRASHPRRIASHRL